MTRQPTAASMTFGKFTIGIVQPLPASLRVGELHAVLKARPTLDPSGAEHVLTERLTEATGRRYVVEPVEGWEHDGWWSSTNLCDRSIVMPGRQRLT